MRARSRCHTRTVQIGPYQLTTELARGGMGAVYEGRDLRTGEPAAVKVLLNLGSEKSRRRLQREAEALRRVQHPGVVRLLDYGLSDRVPFLAMELLRGESLRSWLDREGPASPEQAVAWITGACGAIQACHEAGVLHRDLKPANAFVSATGDFKLTDFGLARDVDPSTSRTQLTSPGVFLGTAGYWAREQALGELDQIGPRTDVHGLGALLYALLTARAPRPSGSLAEVLLSVKQRVEPPSRHDAAVPAWLDAVACKALSPNPADRYASAAELADALRTRRAPPVAPRRAPLPVVLGLVAASAAGAALLLVLGRTEPPLESEPAPAAIAEPVPDASSPGANDLGLTPEPAKPAEVLDPVEIARLEANRSLAAERWTAALDACDRWQALAPRAAGPRCVRGQVWARSGELERGLQEIRAGLALDPSYHRGHQMLAVALSRKQQWAAATDAISEAIRLAPDEGSYRSARGLFLFRQGDYRGAVVDLECAAALGSEEGQDAYVRGRALSQLSRWKESEAAFSRALELDPNEPPWAPKARSSIVLARTEAERAALPAAAAKLDREALQLLKTKRWRRLLEVTVRLAKESPGYALAYQLQAVAHLSLGDPAPARDAAQQAVQLRPDDPYVHSNLSYALTLLGHHAEAVAAATRALELEPTLEAAYENRGLARRGLNRWQGALTDFERALELADEESLPKRRGLVTQARAKLGLEVGDWARALTLVQEGIARRAAGDPRGAAERFSEAIAERPDCAEAYEGRALARIQLGAYRVAEQDVDVAFELSPPRAELFMLRGRARWGLDRRESALPDLRRALGLAPDAEWAPLVRELLAQAHD